MTRPLMLATRVMRRAADFCFGGCGTKFKPYELKRFCTLTMECKEHLGPFCKDCYAIHLWATHDAELKEKEILQ